ncbi:VIR protein [Plasmodium vivax]|uniref:VIR protein n=1 Tax=Plasmodium vivax TaxID=5855 RepID=A0A1G4E3A2_PLAVI|nr:VIR protein [Plasmodium vivax]
MATTEWEDDILRGFPAYAKYDEFNRKQVRHGENNICKEQGIEDGEAKAFCERAVTILRELHNNHDSQSRKDDCVYFQHWFSDQVRRKFSNNDKYFSNYELSNNLFDVINNVNYEEKDHPDRRCYASRNAGSVKVEKDLHDYFRNFNHINCKDGDREKCRMYYNYVNYINDIYKQRKENNLCCYLVDETVERECTHYFNCKDKYNPKHLLESLKNQIEIIERGNTHGNFRSEELNQRIASEVQNYQSSYGSHEVTSFAPQDFNILNERLLRTRKIHNGLILGVMIGVFLGLLFYIKTHSAKLWRKKRRAENINSYMSDVSSNYSSATSETGSEYTPSEYTPSEYTPSDSGASSMYLSYQSSRSRL